MDDVATVSGAGGPASMAAGPASARRTCQDLPSTALLHFTVLPLFV